VPCSMNTSTYRRLHKTVSTCRKSTARIPPAWVRRELPPGGTRPARRRIDARDAQDLPHGGWRHGDAELEQLALDPAMAPQRILPRQAQHQPSDTRGGRRTAGPAPPARVVLSRGQAAVPGQERRGVTGNTSTQRRRDTIRASAANQARSTGSYRTRPACRRSTAFSCRSTSISAAIARSPRTNTTTRPSVRQVSP
jgi:hypothetical protein